MDFDKAREILETLAQEQRFASVYTLAQLMLRPHAPTRANPQVWLRYVQACDRTGRHALALEAHEQAREVCGREWSSTYDGDCDMFHAINRWAAGDKASALTYITTAKENFDNNPQRLEMMGRALQQWQDQRVLAYWQKLLGSTPVAELRRRRRPGSR